MFFTRRVHLLTTMVSTIETRLHYAFYDRTFLERALTRKAYANEQRQKNIPCEDQEIYRTLGDAVLKLALIDLLIRGGAVTRDEITQRKKELEREETLARIGNRLGLASHIRFGAGEQKQKAGGEPYVLAETLEAVIGAIFLDGGYEAAEQCVKRWFRDEIP
jgi:ribonuclease-3